MANILEPLESRLSFGSHALYVPAPAHVVVLVEENHDFSQIIGNSSLPFFNNLASGGASFTNMSSVSDSSLANYLVLFSGSKQGISGDDSGGTFTNHDLAQELMAKGRTFGTYAEGLPYDGYTGGDTGRYVARHDPARNWPSLPAGGHRTFADFPTDSTGFASLPTVSFVIPNLDHDMHDGTPRAADHWAHSTLRAYAAWARTHNSLLIVTWDEGMDTSVNHIATIFYGAMVRPGQYDEAVNHYNVARTLVDMYHLPHMANTGSVGPIRDVWLK